MINGKKVKFGIRERERVRKLSGRKIWSGRVRKRDRQRMK